MATVQKLWKIQADRADAAEARATALNEAYNKLKQNSGDVETQLRVENESLRRENANLALIITQREVKANVLLTKLKDALFDVIKEL